MSTDTEYKTNKTNNGKVLIGLILLLVGGALLLQQITWFIIPDWLFSFPMWVLGFGCYIGARNNFRLNWWIILVVYGVVELIDEIVPRMNFDRLTWPMMIIALGIWLILRRNHKWGKLDKNWNPAYDKASAPNPFDPNGNPADPNTTSSTANPTNPYGNAYGAHYGDGYLDTVAVFSGAKKTILSKDFRGGEVVNVFGGTEINFAMADINGRVVIDVTQIFGGLKLIVPPHWQVVSDVASVFAGVDDKRHLSGIPQTGDKVLVLTGTSIFAGIDIRSF